MIAWTILWLAAPQLELKFDPPLSRPEAAAIERYAQSAGLEGPANEVIERLHSYLTSLDRFVLPRCTVIKTTYRCFLKESPRIAELEITGDLPFGILRSDLERRSSLRAGRRLPAGDYGSDAQPYAELLDKISRRLARFVDERGYDGTQIRIKLDDHSRGKNWCRVHLHIKLGVPLEWGDLEMDGLARADAESMRQRLRRLGRSFRIDILRDRIEKEEQTLRTIGYVETSIDLQTERKGKQINSRIHVNRGMLLQVQFQGQLRISREKLKEALTFSSSRAVNDAQIESSIKALKNLYQAQGFFRPSIRAEDPQLASLDAQEIALKRQIIRIRRQYKDQIKERRRRLAKIANQRQELRLIRRQIAAQSREFRRLVFHISPGRRARCGSVHIPGIPRRLERQLLQEDFLGTKPPQLGRHDGRLVDNILKEDEARIANYLENKGWLVSHVESQLLIQSSDQVRVHFVVSASPPTYIRSISLVGVSDGEADDWDDDEEEALQDETSTGENLYSPLIEALQIKAGSPLLENTAEILRDRTLSFYRRRGYPGTEVNVQMSLTGDGAQFRLIVQEGQRVLFGGLILSGCYRTQRALVLATFNEAKIGQPFNPQIFAKAAAILRSWRVFRRVRVRYLGLTERRNMIFVDISVDEGVSRTLDLTFGYSIEDHFQTTLAWRDRNVLGRAWHLETRGIFGLFIGRRSEIRGALKMPRLLGPNTDFSIEPKVYYREPDRDFPQIDERFFTFEDNQDLILKGVVKVAHRFNRFSTLIANYTYALDRDINEGVLSAVRTGATSLEGNWLRVDNPFNPKNGIHIKGTLKYASPWLAGDANFVSAVGHGTVYLPVGKSIFAANLRGGTLMELGSSTIAGSDLFRLGGERTIRGFGLDSIRLFRDQDTDLSSGRDGHGTRFVSSSVELRVPLGTQRADSGFGVTLFSDVGWIGANDFDQPFGSSMGWSNGLAANYVLPIGPVGVVIAHQTLRSQRPADVDEPDRSDYQMLPLFPQRIGYHISMGYIF